MLDSALRFVTATFIIAAVLAGCGPSPAPVTIDVKVQRFSGWSKEQAEPTEFSQNLGEDSLFTIDTFGDELQFTVTKINSDTVNITPNMPLRGPGESGDGTSSSFELAINEPLELETPTEDLSTTVTLTLVD